MLATLNWPAEKKRGLQAVGGFAGIEKFISIVPHDLVPSPALRAISEQTFLHIHSSADINYSLLCLIRCTAGRKLVVFQLSTAP